MAVDTRTAERNFISGGGGGGRGGFWGHPSQKSLTFRGSEMVFSTFTMRYFAKRNSTWIRCKMTGTSSAYSMYLILDQKHFSSRKVKVLRPSQPPNEGLNGVVAFTVIG